MNQKVKLKFDHLSQFCIKISEITMLHMNEHYILNRNLQRTILKKHINSQCSRCVLFE